MYAAEACEPTEGLTSNMITSCYAVLKVLSTSFPGAVGAMVPHRLHPELGA